MKENKFTDILKENPKISERTDFASRYRDYNLVDEVSAWEKFERKHFRNTIVSHKRNNFLKALGKAAIVILLASATYLIYNNIFGEKTPIAAIESNAVKISPVMASNIDRAKKSGKVGATIVAMSKEEQMEVAEECGLSTEELLEAQRITTIQNNEYWLKLSDGSIIHINGGTRVIYPEHFYGNTRDIYIEGEAYCMIAEDKEHPFIVHTPHGEVKELGTEFNVCTRTNSHPGKDLYTEVVLVKGSIAVRGNNEQREYLMKPGDCATIIDKKEGSVSMTHVDIEPYIAWNTGQFSFRDKSLEDVMFVLSKWYNVEVEFANDEARSILIIGNFDRYESISGIMSAISKTTNTKISINGQRIVIDTY